ncbi:hypothetical protein VKT23_019848 [Stygiomarasmius scandens]|uniref:AMP-dependent synthetase/ligase domain-containing protein n=1 Tax=Marasmiellus scandens TaxID=2682957 RepID=A0ABR1IK97_9AGAR
MGSTPLTNLAESVEKHSSRVAFKIPLVHPETRQVEEWNDVTYSRFARDVELFARYWQSVLCRDEVVPRSVVTLCLQGYSYIDVLHIYGIMKAGYVPQPLTIIPTATFILSLLQKSGSRAVIYEPPYEAKALELSTNLDIRSYRALDSIPDLSSGTTLLDLPQNQAEDIAIYFHTSGSTSGMPKIIPGTFHWLDGIVQRAVNMPARSKVLDKVDICSWMGSICHAAQFFGIIRLISTGSVLVQPIDASNNTSDLIHLIPEAGITQITTFPAAFVRLLKQARVNDKFRDDLARLDAISYGGGSIPPEDEQWACANGINVVNVYASTECGGPILISGGSRFSSHNALYPLNGVECRFEPIGAGPNVDSLDAGIKELVILPESLGCPHSSLRSADGLFHTGDLFREIEPGYYINCGRDDDWIKMENAARCDTRTIEEEVRHSCKDLISECVVVGRYRPRPALFVEPIQGSNLDEVLLRKMVFDRISVLQKYWYETERITSPDMIVSVPTGSLPRTETKGNVRRNIVEERYQTMLDRIYNKS